MNRSLDSVILRYTGYALLFLLGLWLLYMVRGTLPIFFAAGLLAHALEPWLKRLEHRGYSRRGAVGFVFVIFLLLFLLGLTLLASAWQQAQSLTANFRDYEQDIGQMIDRGRTRLEATRLPRDVKRSINEAAVEFQQQAPSRIAEKLQSAVSWVISSVGFLMITVVVLPIITLWLMLEMNALRVRLLMLVPPVYRRDVTEIAGHINDLLGRYVRGQMIVCGLFGLLCTIAFYILGLVYGMHYALVLGLLAGFLYIVPYLGMATVATTAGFTAYFTATSSPLTCALLAVGCCVAFNLTIDYGISPRVLGRGVGLHPLMVIFALLSGAQIGGILGMILAVPVFASLRVVAIHLFPQLGAPIALSSPESRQPDDTTPSSAVLQQTQEVEASTV